MDRVPVANSMSCSIGTASHFALNTANAVGADRREPEDAYVPNYGRHGRRS